MEKRGSDVITKVDADVEDLLSRIGLQHLSDTFRKECITMSTLVEMTKDDLKEIGVEAFGERHTIFKEVRRINQTNDEREIPHPREKSSEILDQESDFLCFIPCSSYSGGNKEIRLILLGKTGVGKSATGNSLLGQKCFESRFSGSSVTSKCKAKKVDRFNKSILVIDTPGLFDTSTSDDATTKEICRCIGVTAPGPHAFLLVLSAGSRFTDEEKKATDRLLSIFGKNMHKYVVIVFTGKDKLAESGTSIENYIDSCPDALQSLIDKCGKRYIAINNFASGSENDQQVKTLLSKVQENLKVLETNHFTSDVYEKAEIIIQEREKVIIARREEWKKDQLQLNMMRISQKYSDISKPLRNKLEKLHKQILDKKEKANLIIDAEKKLEKEQRIIMLQAEFQTVQDEIKRIDQEQVTETENGVKEIEERFNQLEPVREAARKEIQKNGSLLQTMWTFLKIIILALINPAKLSSLVEACKWQMYE